jgi:hypothetical protein
MLKEYQNTPGFNINANPTMLDRAAHAVHNYRVRNRGQYPTFILININTFYEFTDLLLRVGIFPSITDPSTIKFMGAMLIETHKVKEGEFICLGDGHS